MPEDSSGSNPIEPVVSAPQPSNPIEPVVSAPPVGRRRQRARPPAPDTDVVDLTVANPVLGEPIRPAQIPATSIDEIEIVAVRRTTRAPPLSSSSPAVAITGVVPARRPRSAEGDRLTPARRQRVGGHSLDAWPDVGAVRNPWGDARNHPQQSASRPSHPAIPEASLSPKEEAPRCPVCLEGYRNPSCGPCGYVCFVGVSICGVVLTHPVRTRNGYTGICFAMSA